MKRTLKYALLTVLGVMAVAPAFAQDNFPDTPEAHWAAQALENMKKEGILVGYPDGLYRGGRPVSRYEMAVALNAVWQKIKGMNDSMSSKLEELEKALDAMKGGNTGGGGNVDDLKAQIAAMKSDLDSVKGWGDDIQNIKKMADMFKDELASMGVNVADMKKTLQDHEDRLKKLEGIKPAVEIKGDINFLTLMGHGDGSTRVGITPSGRFTGEGRGAYAGQVVGMTRDFSVFHEAAFTLKGTNDEGPQWWATVVTGNLLDGFNTQSDHRVGQGFMEGDSDLYIQTAGASFDTSLAGFKFSAKAGRIGYYISPYLFARTDFTDTFSNSRWDNHEWTFDGAHVKFGFGGVGVNVIAGRANQFNSINGVPVQSLTSGPLSIDQLLGVHVNVPLMKRGGVDLAYLWLDTNNPVAIAAGNANRSNVYGADGHFEIFKGLELKGGYARSTFTDNTSNVLDKNNSAWYGKLNFEGKNWEVWGGYRRVGANFAAPGDWGRLGLVYSPTNIQGIMAGASLNLTPDFEIGGSAQFYEGSSSGTRSNKIDSYKGMLNYKLNSAWNVMASYENTTFKNSGLPKADQRWFTVGFGWAMASNSKLSISYQASDVNNRAGNWFGSFGLPASRYKGGLLVSQLTLKF